MLVHQIRKLKSRDTTECDSHYVTISYKEVLVGMQITPEYNESKIMACSGYITCFRGCCVCPGLELSPVITLLCSMAQLWGEGGHGKGVTITA